MTIADDIGKVVQLMRPISKANLYPSSAVDYMANEFKSTDAGLAPFYLYGHVREINSRLLEKQKDKTFKYQRYPLVALKLDIDEQVRSSVVEYNLNLAFITFTSATMDAEQRMERVFKPLLYPMYERFLIALEQSGLFFWLGQTPDHVKTDRPFWGTSTSNANVQHIFSDPIDAIEITDLKIFQLKNKC